ncbi:arginine repressor [Schaalia suimastitidis]|uniref:arginine repressor n=1 Tax=Schaalia suimastitidis TaxID=121163 RepID=UPI000420F28A|nr:arginine repressor [Schaalia suimastitidis]
MNTAAVPRTKAARQEAIRDLLAANRINSQQELRSQLLRHGFEVTQATLSRDLVEMQATKVRSHEGLLVYTVPDLDGSPTHEGEAGRERLVRWCQSLLTGSTQVGNHLVLRTPVGAASLLGSAIDAVRMDEVAGTIAGDDTILVICRSVDDAQAVEHTLLEMSQPGYSTEK